MTLGPAPGGESAGPGRREPTGAAFCSERLRFYGAPENLDPRILTGPGRELGCRSDSKPHSDRLGDAPGRRLGARSRELERAGWGSPWYDSDSSAKS